MEASLGNVARGEIREGDEKRKRVERYGRIRKILDRAGTEEKWRDGVATWMEQRRRYI